MRIRLRITLALLVIGFAASCSDGTSSTPISGLRFVQQPPNTIAGETFTVTVELLDDDDERLTGRNEVTISTTAGALNGTTTVRAEGGLATFTGISMTKAGSDFRLTATSGSHSANSGLFAIAAGPVVPAKSTMSPATGPFAAYADNVVLFSFRDQFDNPVAFAPITVSNGLAGTIDPAAGITNELGAFETIFRPAALGNASFSVTVNETTVAFTNTFAVQDLCAGPPLDFPGTVSGAIPNGTCVINGFPASSHRFTTTHEFVGRFTLTSPFGATMEISAHPPADNVIFLSSGGQFTSEWLLPAGTYNARVGATSGSGQYNLIGIVGLSENECANRTLVVAGTYSTQQLQPDDCNTDDFDFFTEPDGSRADFFAIQSLRPCTITMRSSVMDSFLFVADWESFGPLEGDNNSGGGVNGQDAQLSFDVCMSGTGPLRIVANHIVPVIGPYTLTISFGAPVAGAALKTARRPPARITK